MTTPTFTVYDPDNDCNVQLPAKWEVCPRCHGAGCHDHSAFGNGISQEDFSDDPDFREDYMRGRYDVMCEDCDGLRVVPQVNESELTPRQRELLDLHYKIASEEAAERRMRASGIRF